MRPTSIPRYVRTAITKVPIAMSLGAVAVFLLFIIAIGALNLYEFGRID